MAAQPVIGSTLWGAAQNAFTGTSLDPATGKIKNEALQVASTAPIADAALANKKYVDDKTAGHRPTVQDSDNNAITAAHAYLTQTSGFLTAYTDVATTNSLSGYVDDTDDPAGAGLLMGTSDYTQGTGDGSMRPFISFFVAEGWYFEITYGVPANLIVTWTPTKLGGGNPIDQD